MTDKANYGIHIMGDIIDFKSRQKVEYDDSNIIILKRDRVYKVSFSCGGESITMNRNEDNTDISLSMWKERIEGQVKQLGVAMVPAEDIDEAIARLDTLVAFADIDEVTEI